MDFNPWAGLWFHRQRLGDQGAPFSILDAWHGSLALQDSPLGGLRVVIRLPMRREAS
ncbi:hypothetical protein [Azotobacter armeniacus]